MCLLSFLRKTQETTNRAGKAYLNPAMQTQSSLWFLKAVTGGLALQ